MATNYFMADKVYGLDVATNTRIYPVPGSYNLADVAMPETSLFLTSLEKNFDILGLVKTARANHYIIFLIAALYLLFIYFGPRVMAKRKPLNLHRTMVYWNLFLAIFSIMGFIRFVPYFLAYVYTIGFKESLCAPPFWMFSSGPAAFWLALFSFSKIAELFDTVLIVLKKKPLSFLHWFHHATVLLYTWDCMIKEQPMGVHYCAVNLTVHSVMYLYYYLAASRAKRPPWAKFVTLMQISQMIYGAAITFYGIILSFHYPFLSQCTLKTGLAPFDVPGCFLDKSNLVTGVCIYVAYFYLFASFFLNRYVKCKPASKRA